MALQVIQAVEHDHTMDENAMDDLIAEGRKAGIEGSENMRLL